MSIKKYKAIKKKIIEDAPTNNAGSGKIAGIGVGPQGEPGVSPKNKYKEQNAKDAQAILRRLAPVMEVKRGKFAGHETFLVPSKVFVNIKNAKRKGAHWTKYLDENGYGRAIREFANKNPRKPICLEDETTGYLCYARYGKR